VVNTNLASILHRFRSRSIGPKSLYSATLLYLTPQTEGFSLDDLRKILPGCQ